MAHVTAIIPARGGSKGIPKKNIKPFLGKPLIARAIAAARNAGLVDDVIVSSDCPDILAVARNCGADTVLRPADLAEDTSSSEVALLHALETSEAGRKADVVAFLQCTSPFTTADEIDAVVGALETQRADVTFSAIEVHVFLWVINEDGSGRGVNHDAGKPRQRRQDRPRQFRETGAIYAIRKEGLLASKSRFFGRVVPVELPGAYDIDLDTPRDWQLAEAFGRLIGGT
jgi:CMP-N-acetylneuraminic acid synthetase